MKSLLVALALVSSVAAEARSLAAHPILAELFTDDPGSRFDPSNPDRFEAVKVRVSTFGYLIIDSRISGRRMVKIHENVLEDLRRHAFTINASPIKEIRQRIVCQPMPGGIRDSLSIASGLSYEDPNLVGNLKPVWLEGGCMYHKHLRLEQESARSAAAAMIAALRALVAQSLLK